MEEVQHYPINTENSRDDTLRLRVKSWRKLTPLGESDAEGWIHFTPEEFARHTAEMAAAGITVPQRRKGLSDKAR